jgi:hypothetical protein
MWYRQPVLAIAWFSLLAASASDAMGQRRAEAKVAASPQHRVVQLDAPAVGAAKRPSLGKHILVGSLIGAAATVGGIWYTVARHPDQECMGCPIWFATIVVGGAAVGGLVGAFVYAAREPAKR